VAGTFLRYRPSVVKTDTICGSSRKGQFNFFILTTPVADRFDRWVECQGIAALEKMGVAEEKRAADKANTEHEQ
jgi:hypothetical protein